MFSIKIELSGPDNSGAYRLAAIASLEKAVSALGDGVSEGIKEVRRAAASLEHK